MQKTANTLERTQSVRKKRRFPLGTVLVYLLCIVVALITLFPFVWMILGSLKSATEVTRFPPTLFPDTFVWQNYVEVFTSVPFLRYIFNSFVVASTVTFVALIFHAMAGYSLARLEYPGRDWFFIGIVMTLMIPFSVTLIPTFILVRSLGWLDTYAGLIVPSIFNAFGIFSVKTVLPGASGRVRGGCPARWSHARRYLLSYRPATEPSYFGDTCRVLFSVQLEQLPLATGGDSVGGDAGYSGCDCWVCRRTRDAVAAHYGGLDGCGCAWSASLSFLATLPDRRH